MPDDETPAYGPAFYVPSYPGDFGQRPLPAGVTWWDCAGIRLDGMSRVARGPLVPGETVRLTVDIGNAGTASGTVWVSIYRLDPTLAFSPDRLQQGWITSFVERRDPGETKTSAPRTWVTDITTPKHVCLLVRLHSPVDVAPTTIDAQDRHYAQLNLNFVAVQPGAVPIARFHAANPTDRPARFRILARPISNCDLATLATALGKRPFRVSAEEVRLGPADHVEGPRVDLELRPHEQALLEAHLPTLTDLDPDSFASIAFEQIDLETGRAIGAYSIVFTAERR